MADYTYSIASDFPDGAVNTTKLHTEIETSSIVTALDGISTSGDVLTITFKASLSSQDKTTLDGDAAGPAGGLIASTDNSPSLNVTPVQFMDSNGNVKPINFDQSGNFLTSSMKPTLTKDNRISFNWCDKTTWYEAAATATNETLTDDGSHTTFTSANAFWIDMYHGNVWQEDNLLATNGGKWVVTVKVNGVTKTQDSPGQHDHDYTVNFAAGHVVFNSSQVGNTVTATYWYAASAVFTIAPLPGNKMTFTRVEIQFSDDIDLQDTTVFQPYGYVQVFAPQYCPSPYPLNTIIPLGNPLKYKSMTDFYNESNGAYPVIQPLSNAGGNWRGMDKNVVTMAWDYISGTQLFSSYGMSIVMSLANNVPHGGAYATSTIYALTEPE